MPEQRYSIGESCALLDIDRVTLSRWLEDEKMQPEPGIRDKRYKYLTREQLVTLAHAHDRTIREETALTPRLTGWQRDIAARVAALEAWRDDLRRDYLLVPRRPPPLASPAAPQQPYTPRPVAEWVPRNAPSESRYSASEERALPVAIERDAEDVAGPGRHALQPGEWPRLPRAPQDWVTIKQMAERLGISDRTFRHALRPRWEGDKERYGSLAYHRGRWQGPPGTYLADLLDPEQQEAALEWARGRTASALRG